MTPTPETLFLIANSAALIGWIALIFFPKQRFVTNLLLPVVGCGSLAVLYLLVMLRFAGEAEGGFTSLDDVESLFRDRGVLLAGWVHYLVFDLFVGCWQVRDARQLGISHWWVIPALLLTFMVGPIGLLVYYLIRLGATRQFAIGEFPPAATLSGESTPARETENAD